jgi:uncharacterized protein involved in exopolysaccharide biosynthesis
MADTRDRTGSSGDIDLVDVFRLLWFGRLFILRFVLLFAALGVAVALYLPNQYRSEAIFKPAAMEELPGGSGLLAQVGALTGFNIGLGSSTNADVAVEMLRSRPFLVDFARNRDVVVPLMAGKVWDRTRGELILDPELYDPTTKRWIRVVDPPLTPEPTDDEIYVAMKEIVSVEQDLTTRFVRVSVTFLSPELAQQWLEQLVRDLNEQLRQKDIAIQERSISYLTERLKENTLSGLDSDLSELLRNAIRDHMLAKVREEYALETIARPFRPILKSEPNRALLSVAATVLGGLLGVFALVFSHSRRPYASEPPLLPLSWLGRIRTRMLGR